VLSAIPLIFGAIFLKGKKKKISIALCILFVLVPLCFVAFLGLFKIEIQKGNILPSFGQILILIAPPDDLWVPLGEEYLTSNTKEYHFEFTHKYVGNHVVEISFKQIQIMETADNNFEVEYRVTDGQKEIFNKKSNKGWPYWGQKNSGLTFISYQVPDELPVNTKVFATIKVKGNITSFTKKYGSTRLSIRKGSDL